MPSSLTKQGGDASWDFATCSDAKRRDPDNWYYGDKFGFSAGSWNAASCDDARRCTTDGDNGYAAGAGNSVRCRNFKRRKTRSPSNWLAGAVRILKKATIATTQAGEDLSDPERAPTKSLENAIFYLGSKMDELSDTTFGRFGVVEESITGISDSVKEVTVHINNAAKIFNDHTLKSLQENDTVLRELSEKGFLKI